MNPYTGWSKYDLLLQPVGLSVARPIADCTPFQNTKVQVQQPGWPYPADAGFYTKIAEGAGWPHTVTVDGTWKDFGYDMTSFSLILEDPDGNETEMMSRAFSPRSTAGDPDIDPDPGTWSAACSITKAGLWILWMRAGDAGGRMAEFTHIIEATA